MFAAAAAPEFTVKSKTQPCKQGHAQPHFCSCFDIAVQTLTGGMVYAPNRLLRAYVMACVLAFYMNSSASPQEGLADDAFTPDMLCFYGCCLKTQQLGA